MNQAALAERIEQAEGPNRELDREITVLVWQWAGAKVDAGFEFSHIDEYTASLDAAMTLVPETMTMVDLTLSWEPAEPGVWPAASVRWYPPHKSGPDWHALTVSARTPALALCAAALRARAATTEGEGNG